MEKISDDLATRYQIEVPILTKTMLAKQRKERSSQNNRDGMIHVNLDNSDEEGNGGGQLLDSSGNAISSAGEASGESSLVLDVNFDCCETLGVFF